MQQDKHIIRVEKNINYTTINNTSMQDQRLSWKAKGIHAFMLTRPDNWVFYNEEVQEWAKDGRDSLLAGIKELQKFGYIRKERHRNEHGKFDYITIVYEVPMEQEPPTGKPSTDLPSTEKPLTGKPLTENPQLISTNKLNTNTLSTNSINTEEGGKEEVNANAKNPPPLVHSVISQELLKIKSHFETRVHFSEAAYEHVKVLDDFLDNYRDADLIIEAMKIAVERAKPHLPYINGILKTWRTDGVTNCMQLKAVEAQKAKQHRPYKQGREEQLPDWFDQHQEQQLAYTQQQSVPKQQQPVVNFEAEREKVLAKLGQAQG